MGAISDLIHWMKGDSVAHVAPVENPGATLLPPPPQGVASVAPVAPQGITLQTGLGAVETPIPISREYLADHGVHLLAEDMAFLRWHLPRATRSRNLAIRRYIKTWLLAAEAEAVLHRKENAGRYAANCWLRGINS